MDALVGKARDQVEQRKWLWTAAIGGVMGGALLWVVLAAMLPWGIGDRMAALPVSGGDQWKAGQTLLSRSSPSAWERMARLFNACGDQSTELCEAAIVIRAAPTTPNEKASSQSSVPTARPVPRSRSGQPSP